MIKESDKELTKKLTKELIKESVNEPNKNSIEKLEEILEKREGEFIED